MEELAVYGGVALGLVLLDLFVPSSGLLSGAGIALLIERVLAAAGVATGVRIPLAAVGMLACVGLAVRYGERITERLSPVRTRTNADRLVGLTGQVRRLGDAGPVVELEGDLWTARSEGALEIGDEVEVVALVDQVPVVRRRG